MAFVRDNQACSLDFPYEYKCVLYSITLKICGQNFEKSNFNLLTFGIIFL